MRLDPVLVDGLVITLVKLVFGAGSSSNDKWITFQRRTSGDLDFYLGWEKYKAGFCGLNGDLWFGLEKMHQLTSSRAYEMRIEFTYDGKDYYAEYRSFKIGSEADFYKITFSGFSGNVKDSMAIHYGMKFSTKDKDNDEDPTSCATHKRSAWWFKNCLMVNLNGNWGNRANAKGLNWFSVTGLFDSATSTKMMMRPVSACNAGKFACLDGDCIAGDQECDGVNHCSDNSDEHAYCPQQWGSWGPWSSCTPCSKDIKSDLSRTRTRTCSDQSSDCLLLIFAYGVNVDDTETGTCSEVCPENPKILTGGRTKLFDCRRGQSCNNNFACNYTTGQCTCDPNTHDFNCNNQLKDNSECAHSCLLGHSSYCGALVTDESDVSCRCNSDRHMDNDGNCRQNVRHICFRDEFKIEVVMPSFEGKAYLTAPKGDCELDIVEGTDGQMAGQFTYSDCSRSVTEGVFDIELVLQFSKHYLTPTDLHFDMQCKITDSGAVLAPGNHMANFIPAEDGHTRLKDYTSEIVIVTAFEKDTDVMITKAHAFKDPFYLKYERLDNNYTKISLKDCLATDEGRKIEFKFLQDQCPVEEAAGLVWMMPTRAYTYPNSATSQDYIIYIGLNSFKVAQSSQTLVIRCSLYLCTDEANDDACAMSSCDNDDGETKRKRRSAKDSKDIRLVNAETTIVFRDDIVADEGKIEIDQSDEDHDERRVYIGVITALAVLLTIACVTVAVLACENWSRTRKSKTTKDEEAPSRFSIYLPRVTASK